MPPNIALEMSATPHAKTGFTLLGTVDESSRGFDKSYQILTTAHGNSANQARARGRGAGAGQNNMQNHLNCYHELLPDGSLITKTGSLRVGLKPPSGKAMCVVSLAVTTRSVSDRKRLSVHADRHLRQCLLARRARSDHEFTCAWLYACVCVCVCVHERGQVSSGTYSLSGIFNDRSIVNQDRATISETLMPPSSNDFGASFFAVFDGVCRSAPQYAQYAIVYNVLHACIHAYSAEQALHNFSAF